VLFDLKIALASLQTHRLRTILAVAGVFLGAFALSGVQHATQALQAKTQMEVAKLGTNLLLVRTGQVHFRRDGGTGSRNEARTFTLEDARVVAESLVQARLSAPFVTKTMPIRAGDIKVPCQLVATWPDYAQVRGLTMAQGRFLMQHDEDKREKVVVLGDKIAQRLFGQATKAMGEQVFFFRGSARVIGVMAPKGADISGTDQDEQVFVPLSTFMRRLANQDWITGVYIQLANPGDEIAAKQSAGQIMARRHPPAPGKKEDFSVVTAQDTIQLQRQALDLVETLGLISSGISFAVGGLGILSLMTLLVRTRRVEIGVRRAVGARKRDIVRQFCLESGLMAAAGGGTLFLDEISEVPLHLQAKLLRALEEREVLPVGAVEPEAVDLRLIAATNRNLEEMVEQGSFRQDLFYRLDVVELRLPALSEREEDIPPLVEHFVRKYSREMKKPVRAASPEVLRLFRRHRWKGNVRELENAVERAMIFCDGETLLPEHLSSQFVARSEEEGLPDALKEATRLFEQRHVRRQIELAGGDKPLAARRLEISLSSLYRKLED